MSKKTKKKLDIYAPATPPKLFVLEIVLEIPKPGSFKLKLARLMHRNIEIKDNNMPSMILTTNDLKFPYLNIIKNCNTIRLRYFEGNYERNKI